MFVWDAHAGLPPSMQGLDPLAVWSEAGIGYVSVNVGFDVMPWYDAFRVLGAYRAFLAEHDDRYVLVESYDDVEAAKASGRLAVMFDLEGLNALAGDVRLIEVYHALGVRQMLFAYNLNNEFAGGCHDEDTGLTELGREAVAEMNRLGVIVDCTHAGRRSTLEIMDESRKPVVFSHSNCVAVHPHGRNIEDDQIRACAATGGVVGINGISLFLGPFDPIEGIVRHVARVAELVGTEHVGLGLDSTIDAGETQDILVANPRYWPADQGYASPVIFVQPGSVGDIASALAAAGFGSRDVSLILGENFARVAREVWA
jgi:membrane dipeptidase